MDTLEKIESENKVLISKLTQLAQTEDSRASVESAVFIRTNSDLRLQNIQDIRKDIAYGAKNFGQLPDKYTTSQDSIVKSYIEQTNRFMKLYNDEFLNIKSKIQNAEENQKALIFKGKKLSIMKQLYIFVGRPEEQYKGYDSQIEEYKKQIRVYEEIITRCDKEFKDCKNRREQDFQEIFGIGQPLAVVTKMNIFQKILTKIKNKLNGYENFSKYVLQKYSSKISSMKTGLIDMYANKIKQNIVNFSNEIEEMKKRIGVQDG